MLTHDDLTVTMKYLQYLGGLPVSLDKEFKFYQENKEKFLAKYENKFIVIVEKEVVGVYDNQMEAINETRKDYALGTFLVQHVVKDDSAFFHSRVSITNVKSA